MTITGVFVGLLAGLLKMGIELSLAFVTAIPFTLAWNNLAPIYARGLIPDRLLHLPFWHVWGGLILVVFFGEIIARLSPKLVSVTQQESKSKKE